MVNCRELSTYARRHIIVKDIGALSGGIVIGKSVQRPRARKGQFADEDCAVPMVSCPPSNTVDPSVNWSASQTAWWLVFSPLLAPKSAASSVDWSRTYWKNTCVQMALFAFARLGRVSKTGKVTPLMLLEDACKA